MKEKNQKETNKNKAIEHWENKMKSKFDVDLNANLEVEEDEDNDLKPNEEEFGSLESPYLICAGRNPGGVGFDFEYNNEIIYIHRFTLEPAAAPRFDDLSKSNI